MSAYIRHKQTGLKWTGRQWSKYLRRVYNKRVTAERVVARLIGRGYSKNDLEVVEKNNA